MAVRQEAEAMTLLASSGLTDIHRQRLCPGRKDVLYGPGRWTYSADRHRTWAAASVHAEDSAGGMYLSQFGGSTGHGSFEELTLSLLPRLNRSPGP
jgi:hypothetical protein